MLNKATKFGGVVAVAVGLLVATGCTKNNQAQPQPQVQPQVQAQPQVQVQPQVQPQPQVQTKDSQETYNAQQLSRNTILSLESQMPTFSIIEVEDKNRAITVAKTAPYNCVALGEIEGKDSAAGTRGATTEVLRTSALNDLKNEAGFVVDATKRKVMLQVLREVSLCLVDEGLVDCNKQQRVEGRLPQAFSYRIQAQVFDCGSK